MKFPVCRKFFYRVRQMVPNGVNVDMNSHFVQFLRDFLCNRLSWNPMVVPEEALGKTVERAQ